MKTRYLTRLGAKPIARSDVREASALVNFRERPDHGTASYRIVRRGDGNLYLYRGDDLVDVDREDDGDALTDIERWGTGVAWAEDYTVIQRWEREDRDGRWHILVGVAFR
jgi:hypothetical protein